MDDRKILNRKRKTKDPCKDCGLNRSLCICSVFPRLDLKTRICLVIHAKELKRTTNTGKLAIKSLVNSEMRVRGDGNQPLDLSDILTERYQTLLFYPSDDALDLTTELIQKDPRPVQLIVPDGNWRQASKVHYRHHELKNIPRVMIKAANASKFHLRPETTAEGMATLQAIAFALGVIEGDEVKQSLLKVYNAKLENTLRGRGLIEEKVESNDCST